jgi:hypothetical protein
MLGELFVGLSLFAVGISLILFTDRFMSSSYVQRRRDFAREFGFWYPSESVERVMCRVSGAVFVVMATVLAFG